MIEVQNLTKEYGAHLALDGVSFTVPQGQVLGLLGLNGAGKSTTMNILTGCLAPTDGTVCIGGIDMGKHPAKAKKLMGYLPELPPLYMDMKVGEYLDFVFALKKLKGDKKAAVQSAAAQAGVDGVLGRVIRNLSKGYRQRVGLAAALVGDPKVLILDEPTVGLDPSQIIEIRTLISQLGKERTVILSSHILTEIQAVCERVIVLNRGKIVADDSPERLESAMRSRSSLSALIEGEPQTVLALLQGVGDIAEAVCLGEREKGVWEYRLGGKENGDIRRPLFYALAEAKLPLLEIHSADVSLEDVFLRLVGQKGEEGRP